MRMYLDFDRTIYKYCNRVPCASCIAYWERTLDGEPQCYMLTK